MSRAKLAKRATFLYPMKQLAMKVSAEKMSQVMKQRAALKQCLKRSNFPKSYPQDLFFTFYCSGTETFENSSNSNFWCSSSVPNCDTM